MDKKPVSATGTANDGYRPLTEGYQPGSQIIQKGFTPPPARQPPLPKGGSSATKPASFGATPPKK